MQKFAKDVLSVFLQKYDGEIAAIGETLLNVGKNPESPYDEDVIMAPFDSFTQKVVEMSMKFNPKSSIN